jgi:cell division protease FtsH
LGRDIGHEQNYSDSIAYEIDQEMQNFITSSYERCKDLLLKHSKEMHLIANTLLEKETLELDQIKELIEQGFLSEDSKAEGGEGVALEVGEPIIDNIGDVKVRIQGKPEDAQSTAPDLSKDIPNNPESEGNDGSDDDNKGGGTSLT